MSLTGINHYEQHIVFSNRIVHCVLDINPDQSLNNQLLWCSLITAYVVPFVLYQIYQVFSINMDFQTTINTLQAMCGALCITFTYASSNIQLETVKNLIVYIKHDYEHFLDKNELCILDKYTKLTKIYTIICVGFTSTYYFSLTLPSILDVGMHILGLSENMKLTLPFYVNNISSSGLVYYSMLLNELIIITIVLTIGFTITSDIAKKYNQNIGMFCNGFRCQVPFYILSKKNQKLLLLITMRSIKPCELSIGGLFTASHEIFAGLMQKAFSFAMAYYSLIQAN
ncbi:hypothetical protein M0802_011816 [Mischocyttarus mexicanus]|nr:hypothetical protein M0802_011816 [Mischocyttarus mexicanus]